MNQLLIFPLLQPSCIRDFKLIKKFGRFSFGDEGRDEKGLNQLSLVPEDSKDINLQLCLWEYITSIPFKPIFLSTPHLSGVLIALPLHEEGMLPLLIASHGVEFQSSLYPCGGDFGLIYPCHIDGEHGCDKSIKVFFHSQMLMCDLVSWDLSIFWINLSKERALYQVIDLFVFFMQGSHNHTWHAVCTFEDLFKILCKA